MTQMFKSDDGAALRFFEVPVKNTRASEKTGKPEFDTCLMVEVLSPGSKESAPHFECERKFCDTAVLLDPSLADKPRRSRYYDKYVAQINAYRAQTSSTELNGTPLSQWPQMDVGTVETLNAVKIFTVEGLASVPDSQLNGVGPGARKLRDQAKAWLSSAATGADTSALVAELDTTKTDLERVTKERDDALGRVTALESQLAVANAAAGAQKAQATPQVAGKANPLDKAVI